MGHDQWMFDPLQLGRSVVVQPGATVPEPWAGCPRVAVTQVDATTADTLSAAWRARRAVVVELVPGLGLDDPEAAPDEAMSGAQPWQWPVTLDLVGERLHHGIWANAVDARRGPPVWRWAVAACRLGARPAGPDARADIVLADGTAAVCDGGPLDTALAQRLGVPVVHSVMVEHGRLQPLGCTDLSEVALAPDQLAAVAEPAGAARVIAPAGSGKTRVLTERARLLLGGWGLPPSAVVLVAFNVRAAGEMRSRLADLPDVRIRTLNALGLRLCGNRSTIDEPEVRRLLDTLVSFPRRSETDPAAPWMEALGRVRLGLCDPGAVEDEVPDVADLDRVARAYRALLAERGVVDFDEQVVGAVERLLGDPAFRRRSQRHARILLVDEFQDLTPAHVLLLRLLAGPGGSVFAVGDDDQTIYGYAGASPRWLVDFDQIFPGARSHALEVNYRCPAPVVAAAANLLTRNAVRVAKTIRPAPDRHLGYPSALSVLSGPGGPATRTAQQVRRLVEDGAAPTDVAVLARVHASLAPVQVLLRHDGVVVSGAVDSRFTRRGGVRAALAWLAVATAPAGELPGPVLREAARHPRRAMSASLLDLVAKQRAVGSLASLAGWLEAKGSDREAGKVRDLAGDVVLVRRAAQGATTAAVLSVVRNRIGDGGLDATAAALDQWSHGAIAAHGDDLAAMEELAELEPDPVLFGPWLADQLAIPAEDGGVTLASIHGVKGREWPHVVLHNVSDGLLPHRLADDVEEERRVFHVALTRGSRTVTVVPGSVPSPFLDELSEPGQPAAVSSWPSTATGGVRPPHLAAVSANRDRRLQPVSDPARRRVAGEARAAGSTSTSRRPGARTDNPVELVDGAVGTRFTDGGYQYEVEAVTDSGVRARVGDGPAATTVAFGTVVVVEGRSVMLAHPGSASAWARLRAWRSEQAATLGKPAFVVVDDKTLRLLAARLPTTEPGLLAISGIGPVKLQSFGDQLIALAEELRGAVDRHGGSRPAAGRGASDAQ